MNFNFISDEQEKKIHEEIVKIADDNIGSDWYYFHGHSIHDDCEPNNFSEDSDIVDLTVSAILHRIFTEEALQNFKQDEISQHVKEIFETEMDQYYYCTRTWSAWSYNTMTGDDFEKVVESENFPEIVKLISESIMLQIIHAQKDFITKGLTPSEITFAPAKRL